MSGLGDAVDRAMEDHVARIDWSRDRLASARTAGLRSLLATAAERSPWHRERLRQHDLTSIEASDIATLEPMTKSDLMASFDDIVTVPELTRERCERHLRATPGEPLLERYHVVASGGSSGLRGVFAYADDEWVTCYASTVRFQTRDWARDPATAGVGRVVAVVAASSPTHLSSALSRTFSTGSNARQLLPVSLPLAQIVDGLNALRPNVLMGYSSYLARLAVEATTGRLRITPRRVVAISEPLLPEARTAIAAAWDAPVANGYGMSEGVFTGDCGDGIHLPDDLCIVEPVDAQGRATAPGELSDRVLVTNLYNRTQPLIRYEVTDQLTLVEGPCPCGSHLARIADPQGRSDDTFDYRTGTTVHPHVFRSALADPAIIEYQVRQKPNGADVDIVAIAAVDTVAIATGLERALRELGLDSAEVSVSVVESIARQESGKLKRFVTLDQ